MRKSQHSRRYQPGHVPAWALRQMHRRHLHRYWQAHEQIAHIRLQLQSATGYSFASHCIRHHSCRHHRGRLWGTPKQARKVQPARKLSTVPRRGRRDGLAFPVCITEWSGFCSQASVVTGRQPLKVSGTVTQLLVWSKQHLKRTDYAQGTRVEGHMQVQAHCASLTVNVTALQWKHAGTVHLQMQRHRHLI